MDNPNAGQPAQTPEDKEIRVGKYLVKVVKHLCIGAASCVAVSPVAFQLDGENRAYVPEGADDSPDNVLLAAQSCPTKAIIIVDAETGQQVWPS